MRFHPAQPYRLSQQLLITTNGCLLRYPVANQRVSHRYRDASIKQARQLSGNGDTSDEEDYFSSTTLRSANRQGRRRGGSDADSDEDFDDDFLHKSAKPTGTRQKGAGCRQSPRLNKHYTLDDDEDEDDDVDVRSDLALASLASAPSAFERRSLLELVLTCRYVLCFLLYCSVNSIKSRFSEKDGKFSGLFS